MDSVVTIRRQVPVLIGKNSVSDVRRLDRKAKTQFQVCVIWVGRLKTQFHVCVVWICMLKLSFDDWRLALATVNHRIR